MSLQLFDFKKIATISAPSWSKVENVMGVYIEQLRNDTARIIKEHDLDSQTQLSPLEFIVLRGTEKNHYILVSWFRLHAKDNVAKNRFKLKYPDIELLVDSMGVYKTSATLDHPDDEVIGLTLDKKPRMMTMYYNIRTHNISSSHYKATHDEVPNE